MFILKQCKWLPLNKLIDKSVINTIHNIITKKTPTSLYDLYKIPNRQVVDISTKYKPKTAKTEKFFIYSGIRLYNKLPSEIKNAKNFKVKLRSHMDQMDNDSYD